jgi:pimeloyl-ACP methyl ester carboxylesterase
MPAVLVHGVPETSALWDDLVPLLGRDDVVAVQLPGFGTPRPDGFGATKEEYVDWLVGELEKIGEPIDLVGHDWGGGLVIRLVSIRPDLVRSWVSDAAGLGDVNFEWHDFAKIWQTPGAGEEFWDQQLGQSDAERGAVFEAFGVAKDEAEKMGGAIDRTMADCILALYRSATEVGKQWGPDFENVPKPGLIFIPSDDPFLSADSAKAGATRAGAQTADLSGVGHWWMLQDPALGAKTLESFWGGLG